MLEVDGGIVYIRRLFQSFDSAPFSCKIKIGLSIPRIILRRTKISAPPEKGGGQAPVQSMFGFPALLKSATVFSGLTAGPCST